MEAESESGSGIVGFSECVGKEKGGILLEFLASEEEHQAQEEEEEGLEFLRKGPKRKGPQEKPTKDSPEKAFEIFLPKILLEQKEIIKGTCYAHSCKSF